MYTRTALTGILLAHLGGIVHDFALASETSSHHHHRGHHHHHKHHHKHAHAADAASDAGHNASVTKAASTGAVATNVGLNASVTLAKTAEADILGKMQTLEKQLSTQGTAVKESVIRGRLHVNRPLPADFKERFIQAVVKATGCVPGLVTVAAIQEDPKSSVAVVDIEGPVSVVHSVEDQAADPYSKLSNGPMRPFLVAGETPSQYAAIVGQTRAEPPLPAPLQAVAQAPVAQQAAMPAAFAVTDPTGSAASVVADFSAPAQAASAPAADCPAPCNRIDVDTEMPYGELEPFGREDTAQELTEQSIGESNEMVDQLERAEVAEEKRAVFRALTRLRGAAITSFDGVARSQTSNIDEYNKVHKWRMTHPLRHLADEESDISRWAFPDNADF